MCPKIAARQPGVTLNNILSFPKEIWQRLAVAVNLTLLSLTSQTSFNAIGRAIRVEKFPDRDFSDDAKTDEIINHTTQRICGITPIGKSPDEVESLVTEFSSHATIVWLLNLRRSALLQIDRLAGVGASSPLSTSATAEKSVDGAWACFKSWRQAHSIAKSARKTVEARKALKFDVSGSDIAQTVTLISVSLVAGGFFYQVVFFKKLGIDITRYLSISDYLSASIGAISPAAVSMGLNAGGMFVGMLSFTKSNKITQQVRIKNGARFTWIFRVTVILMALMQWIVLHRFPYEILPLLIWVFGVIYIPEWCNIHFKRPIFMSFAFLFVIYFSASIYSKAEINAVLVKNGDFFKGDGDRVALDDSVKSLIPADNFDCWRRLRISVFCMTQKVIKCGSFRERK
jgi:hypothetical protein